MHYREFRGPATGGPAPAQDAPRPRYASKWAVVGEDMGGEGGLATAVRLRIRRLTVALGRASVREGVDVLVISLLLVLVLAATLERRVHEALFVATAARTPSGGRPRPPTSPGVASARSAIGRGPGRSVPQARQCHSRGLAESVEGR
jgi:hypothetical protein